ncbi:MAG: Rieske (2Fe-2S) protein, partial [Myxococcales bacterium]|nr:Rieske (2Fe-2S) protein [Myxococcales bacterium]
MSQIQQSYRYTFPPYPIGWFQVAYSSELEKGQVMPLEYFGQDLVLYRTDEGEAVVLDAFCPHLGAHMGYGGMVEGSSIRCPFHHWRFDCTGACDEIPYTDREVPKKAVMKAWTVREVNGLIMVWHHPDGAEPHFELPVVTEYGDDAWTFPYKTRRWKIRTRNQEMAENSVDTAHFKYLHGTHNLPEASIEPNGPHLHVVSETVTKAGGNLVPGQIIVDLHGFGFTTTRFVGIVETLLVNSVTPIDEDYVDVRFSFMVKKFGGRDVTEGIGKAYIAEIERQ